MLSVQLVVVFLNFVNWGFCFWLRTGAKIHRFFHTTSVLIRCLAIGNLVVHVAQAA